MDSDFQERHFQQDQDRFQRTLIDYLNTQLDVGFMFCRDARMEKHLTDDGDYALCKENAQIALESVRKVQDRVEDADKLVAIRARADELKKLISEL